MRKTETSPVLTPSARSTPTPTAPSPHPPEGPARSWQGGLSAVLPAFLLLMGSCGTADDVASHTDPLGIHIIFPPGPPSGGGGGKGGSAQLTLSPTLLYFGQVCAGASAARSVELKNTGGSNLEINSLNIIGNRYALHLPPRLPATIKPGSSLSLSLIFNPPQTQPDQINLQATLQIDSNDKNHTTTDLPLSGLVPPQTLALSPRELDFGEQSIGTSSTLRMTLRNAGACPSTLSSFDKSGALASEVAVSGVQAVTLQPGSSRSVNVTLDCSQGGDVSAAVRFLGPGKHAIATAAVLGTCD